MYHYGFGYAWENQELLENYVFLAEFKTRLKQVVSQYTKPLRRYRAQVTLPQVLYDVLKQVRSVLILYLKIFSLNNFF